MLYIFDAMWTSTLCSTEEMNHSIIQLLLIMMIVDGSMFFFPFHIHKHKCIFAAIWGKMLNRPFVLNDVVWN